MSTVVIRDVLAGLAGGKGFIGLAPAGTAAPYFVVSLVSGDREMALGGLTGGRSGSYQVDFYAATYAAADSMADQACDLMGAATAQFSLGAVTDLPDDYSSVDKTFRVSLEFGVQF
ncbi:DUF3168 domain-containing protein [Burkholderia sp. 22PA0099]|uniref:hypothetical protein n=1 Tax=Burkholderia sp. 22PA0099 TaxID=3237372 RepID=UPI0039C25BC2